MKTIVIRTQFECLVLKDGQTLGLIENDAQELVIRANADFILTFFPINDEKCLPYVCRVCINGASVKVGSERCTVVIMPHNCYELVFAPYTLTFSKPQLQINQQLSTPYGNLTVQLMQEFCGLETVQTLQIFDQNKQVFEYKLSSVITNVKLQGLYIDNNFFIVLSGFQTELMYAMFVKILTNEYAVELELLSDKIEINEKQIKSLNRCFDINKHGKVTVYNVVNNAIAKDEEYLVQLKENAKVLPEIVPFAFFESLKLGDIKTCRTYLTETLNNEIDDQHLNGYFRNFVYVRQNIIKTDYISVILVYNENGNYVGKICKIDMQNDKIDNFELID